MRRGELLLNADGTVGRPESLGCMHLSTSWSELGKRYGHIRRLNPIVTL